MEFNVNGQIYKIEEVESDHERLFMDGVYKHGVCSYDLNTIFIWDELPEDRKKSTLTHEVTHAYIEAMGMYSFKEFNHEQLCEFMAAHGEAITSVVYKYFSPVEYAIEDSEIDGNLPFKYRLLYQDKEIYSSKTFEALVGKLFLLKLFNDKSNIETFKLVLNKHNTYRFPGTDYKVILIK